MTVGDNHTQTVVSSNDQIHNAKKISYRCSGDTLTDRLKHCADQQDHIASLMFENSHDE